MAEVQKSTEAGEMTKVFVEFVMMHAQNAALFLGQIPNPRGQEVEVNLPLAKMFIDQLAVIRQRTKGSLSPDEKKVIDSAVSQLQMAFMEVAEMMRAQNLGAELPGPLIGMNDEAEAPSSLADVAPPVAAAPSAPAPANPAPAPEPEREEGRKKFTKSYGA
jgi:hypothetical protein